jgi:hypothetical protein
MWCALILLAWEHVLVVVREVMCFEHNMMLLQ